MAFEINQKVKRNLFIGVFLALALNAIPFTYDILKVAFEYELFGGISVKMLIAIAAFFGMWFIHKRDL